MERFELVQYGLGFDAMERRRLDLDAMESLELPDRVVRRRLGLIPEPDETTS